MEPIVAFVFSVILFIVGYVIFFHGKKVMYYRQIALQQKPTPERKIDYWYSKLFGVMIWGCSLFFLIIGLATIAMKFKK